MSNYTKLSLAVVERMNEITPAALRLYLFLLATRNRKTGQCNPSAATCAGAVDVHIKNIFKLRRELEAKGWARFVSDSVDLLLVAESSENATFQPRAGSENTTFTSSENTTVVAKTLPAVAKTLPASSENATAIYEEPDELNQRKEPEACTRAAREESVPFGADFDAEPLPAASERLPGELTEVEQMIARIACETSRHFAAVARIRAAAAEIASDGFDGADLTNFYAERGASALNFLPRDLRLWRDRKNRGVKPNATGKQPDPPPPSKQQSRRASFAAYLARQQQRIHELGAGAGSESVDPGGSAGDLAAG